MKEINYKKILERLIEEYPHELDKIEKVICDAKKNNQDDVSIEFDEIIKSSVWNALEKARLLTILGYNKDEHDIVYIDEHGNKYKIRDYLYTLHFDILSGFEALMKIYKDIEKHYCCEYISKDESYRNIFNSVISQCKPGKRASYMKAILDNLTEEDIKRLMAPHYEGWNISSIHDKSIFTNIIACKDFNLIKKYIDYVSDVNMYLQEAVATQDTEIVNLFLEKKADINYVTNDAIFGRLTPLKTAIANNDYKMYQFLIEHGADINLQIKSDDFIEQLNYFLNSSPIEIFDGPTRIKSVDENDKNILQLKYIRESTPLEFATKLSKNYCEHNGCYNQFDVHFKGESYKMSNKLSIDIPILSEQVINRKKIVDSIFDHLEDKTNINYNDLIGFTFVTRDVKTFKKYTKKALENNYPIDFTFLFELYFNFYMQNDEKMLQPFMDFIDKYDKDNDLYLEFFRFYIENEVKDFGVYKFRVNSMNKKILDKISKEKRNEICLVPYCRDKKSLEYLLSIGFCINQVDENGRNILYYLLCKRKYQKDELTHSEIELFKYLLENLDLSMKDKDNKTMLYYAMQSFDTQEEWKYAKKDYVGTRSNVESAVAILISKMSKQDVCDNDIQTSLEGRLSYTEEHGDRIYFEYVYQHHKELFDALIDKGFVLSERILADIFDSLYPNEEWKRERLLNTIDMDHTLEFLYQRLDYDREIQKIDIEQEFQNLVYFIDNKNTTFDEFVEALNSFNKQIIQLTLFYENHIQKKFNPKKYLQYVKEKYNTVYDNLNRYLFLLTIKGVKKFGDDKLVKILDAIPNYDVNEYVINEELEITYWDYVAQISDIVGYDKEGYPIYREEHFEADDVYFGNGENISFTGGLMQYAILVDNLPMVQQLQERGAKLTFSLDGENKTWDYVNSYTMMNYMESLIGKKKYSNLDDDEKDYYLGLIEQEEEKQKQYVKKDYKH